MKKTKKFLLIAIAATMVFFGCMKERTTPSDSPEKKISTIAPSQDGIAKQMAKGDTYHWRKSDAEILAQKNAWLNSLQSKSYLSKGGCGTHISDEAQLIQVTRDCNTGATVLTYRVYSLDEQTSSWCESTQSADFNGMPNSASLVYSNVQTVEYDLLTGQWIPVVCNAWQYDGICTSITTLDYQFTIYSSFPLPAGSLIGTLAVDFYLGNTNICPQQNITVPVTTYTSSDYANNPARIYVEANYYASFFFPKTDCDLPCPSPLVICPAGGTFTYWPLSNPNITNQITLQPLNNVFYNFPLGSYGYSCALWYNIGGTTIYSQPKTGTFTVN